MPKKAPHPIPEGMHQVTTHLWFNGNCREAVDFYQRVFGAELHSPIMDGPDGKSVLHAMLKFGDTNIMMADAWPGNWEQGPKDQATTGLFLYTEDCDALFERALEAGCEEMEEMMDAFWGDRMGKVKDPFGHTWAIATYKWIMTPEEMKKGELEWLKTLK